ncbi:cyclase family protein [Arcicella sp. LKC2W]|uniref:cyclase family protein n=1 Tax=Arcicella sp. LKC2W TaxID=2984198 RepID=UPI002B20E168|nr:cyclase family protein [Arcicella sp. LKC2W]MEA5461100.1 cyclase family protein [Arcicella sp. LKC2W]
MKIIDLSVSIGSNIKDPLPFSIRYENHEESVDMMAKIAGVKPTDFEEGKALAGEHLSLTTHAGTHIDAPWHYWPTCNGKPSKTIDELPLEWFFSDGVVLSFLDKSDGYAITTNEIKEALQNINYQLKPFDIVLIRTNHDKKKHEDDYAKTGAGMSAEATHWLIDQGIKVMGIDTWGWDIPLRFQAQEFNKNPRNGVLFAAHLVGREKEYCQIEKLANLDLLPSKGFKVACFPVKIEKASAGWTRAVALLQ